MRKSAPPVKSQLHIRQNEGINIDISVASAFKIVIHTIINCIYDDSILAVLEILFMNSCKKLTSSGMLVLLYHIFI